MEENTIIIIITIIVLLLILLYIYYMYYSYKNKKGIFEYTQPPLQNGFQPFGTVQPLTSEQIAERQRLFPPVKT